MNNKQELLKRITYNPLQCGGKPCIHCQVYLIIYDPEKEVITEWIN